MRTRALPPRCNLWAFPAPPAAAAYVLQAAEDARWLRRHKEALDGERALMAAQAPGWIVNRPRYLTQAESRPDLDVLVGAKSARGEGLAGGYGRASRRWARRALFQELHGKHTIYQRRAAAMCALRLCPGEKAALIAVVSKSGVCTELNKKLLV